MKKNSRKIIVVIISVVLIISAVVAGIFIIDNIRANRGNNEDATIAVYKELIDVLASRNENFAGNSVRYVSIETSKLVSLSDGYELSDEAKKEIVEYLKKYNETVYTMNREDLIRNKLGDEGKLSGYYINISVSSLKGRKAVVNVGHYIGNLGSSFAKYYLTFKDGKWSYEDSGEYVVS